MIREMIMPQLAMGMSEGTVIDWVVKEGERTERDQTLVTIETEKVATELPAPYAGYLHIVAEPGLTVPVETIIARIAETKEEYENMVGGGVPRGTRQPLPASPAAPAPAATQAPPAVAGAAAPAGTRGRIRASGLAKRIAGQQGVDLSSLRGSGPGGRILRRDILAAAEIAPQAATAAPVSTARTRPVAGMRELARVPVAGMRKTIAERMIKSKTTAAHTYLFFEIDVTKLVAARENMLKREEELGGHISMVSILTRMLALACQAAPICNATLVGDQIIIWENVNVGIAVALPGKGDYDSGLVVPVIRNVESKGVLEIDRELKDLVARARAGRLTLEDVADATITLSSTAGFTPGVWAVSTALISLPQVVAFQPGSIIDKPVVVDGQIVVRSILPCGLSFDHRAMDGDPPSRLCKKLIDLIGNPEQLLP